MSAAAAAPCRGVLSHGYLFGFNTDVKSNIFFADEHLVVYPAGHNVVLLNIETRAQQLIAGTASAGITALALTSNRRLLAVAEAALTEKACATVNIYDVSTLKRRKMLSWPEIGSTTITAVSFSRDGRLCLTQGGAPEWKLVLWTAEKAAKVVCSVKVSSPGADGDPAPAVNQADFCPSDSSVICVTGDKIVRFLRVADSQFKPLTLNFKVEPQMYTAHCWLNDDQVVVATEHGDLFLFVNMEFRGAIPSAQAGGSPICALCSFNKGFVAGGGNGVLRIYEQSDEPKKIFKCLKRFNIEGDSSSITNLALSPNEDNLALTTSNSQIYSLALSNTDILKEDAMNFDRVAGPFPVPTAAGKSRGPARGIPTTSRINGASVAVWKPLVATVGMDKALRLWNFQEKSSELISFFDEAPLAVSLHPSGLYLLVSFIEKVRLYSILMEEVRELKEFEVKHCRVACFSGGGQYFAFTNNAQVLVYETFSCVSVAVLKGHQGKIKSIIWRERDRQVLTTSSEGQIYLWEVCTGKRLPGAYQARGAVHAASATRDFSRQFYVGEDMQIRELNLLKKSPDAAGVRSIVSTNCPIGALQVADKVRMLFAGVSSPGMPGAIRAYSIDQGVATTGSGAGGISGSGGLGESSGVTVEPTVDGDALNGEFQEYVCLSLPITCMALNHDGSLLFVGGEDGVMAMFCVAENPKAAEKKIREREAVEYMEEILVTRADINTRSKQVQGMKNAVDELTLNNEYQLRLKDMNYKEKTREITDKFTMEVETDRRAYEDLVDEKKNMDLTYEERIAQLRDQHAEARSALETQHTTKISVEVNRYQVMVQENEILHRKWDEQNQSLLGAHAKAVQRVIEEYDRKVEAEQSQQRELAREKEEMAAAFANLKRLVEEDADTEADFVKAKFTTKLAAEREAMLKFKGENGVMKKKFSHLSKQVEDQKEDMNNLKKKQRDLLETIMSLEKDIQGHKKEMREREETITDKEKCIYDLKKKNQELEKFKFVLDYKIRELKRQLEPREKEISDMRGQIEEMDLELEQYHKSNSALDLMIGELRLKIDGMQKELHAQNKKLEEGLSFNEQFHKDLSAVVQNMASGDNRTLKAAVVALYKLYDQDTSVSSARRGAGGNVQREYNRQREIVERNIEALKKNVEKDMRMFYKDRSRLNRENVVLTKEINDLRRQAKSLSLQRVGIEGAIAGGPFGDPSILSKDGVEGAGASKIGSDATSKRHSRAGATGGHDNVSRGTRVRCLEEGSRDANVRLSAPTMSLAMQPIPPDDAVQKGGSAEDGWTKERGQRSKGNACSDEAFQERQQMWREVEFQEQQIRQLEHHVAKLKETLEAGGLVSSSVTARACVDAVASGAIGREGNERSGRKETDGDLP